MKSSVALLLLVQLFLYTGNVICLGEDSEICVLLKDCRSAWSLSLANLRKRICGYEDDRYAKVWCKVSCVTPDNENGVCTTAYSCQPFMEFLRTSDSNDTDIRTYLRKFVCDSISTTRKHYICCPNKPLRGVNRVTQRPVTPPTKPINPSDEQCGIGNDEYKVIGGTYANLGEHPWAALLQYQSKGKVSFKCGGTLINRRYVLTAAHCINEREGKLINVVLGEHNTSSPVDCYFTSCAPSPKSIGIERVIQHSGWINGIPQLFDDIALLRLAQDVDFSEFIRPICLPTAKSVPTLQTKLTVAGWGRADNALPSDVKRLATLYRVDSSKCLNTIPIALRETQVCVGGGKVDSCKGDSGGPLMKSIDTSSGIKVWYLVGVVSLGYDKPCGTPNKPGIYTSVSHYIDWIQQNIR